MPETFVQPTEQLPKLWEQPDPLTGRRQDDFEQVVADLRRERVKSKEPTTVFGKAVDFLLRTNFASAKFVDELLRSDQGLAFGRALAGAFDELVSPEERLSFGDLIKTHSPEFAEACPECTVALGFAGDVLADPVTYLSFGALTGPRAVVRARGPVKELLKSGRFAKSAVKRAGTVSEEAFRALESKMGKDVLDRILKPRGRKTRLSIKELSEVTDPKKFTERVNEAVVRAESKKGFRKKLGKQKIVQRFGVTEDQVRRVIDTAKDARDTELFDVALSPTGVDALKRLRYETAGSGLERVEFDRTVQEKLAQLISDPELGPGLVAKGGIRFAGQTVVGGSKLAEFFNVTGISKAKQALADLPAVQDLTAFFRNAFSQRKALDVVSLHLEDVVGRDSTFKILNKYSRVENLVRSNPERIAKRTGLSVEEAGRVRQAADEMMGQQHEFIRLKKSLEARLTASRDRIARQTLKLFRDVDKDGRKELGRALLDARDAVVLKAREQGRKVSPQQAAKLFRDVMEREVPDHGRRALAYSLQQEFARVQSIEQEAGLLGHLVLNYTPRRYETIRSARTLTQLRKKWFNRVAGTFTPGQKAKFELTGEAIEAGFEPVTDAATLYALRLSESHQQLAKQAFDEGVEVLFGGQRGIPAGIRDQIDFIGEGLYSRANSGTTTQALSRVWDKITSVFRRSATVMRLAFGGRNLVSNMTQQFAADSARVMGLFDPVSYGQALKMSVGRDDLVEVTTALGEKITGRQLREEFLEQGVLKHVDVTGLGSEFGAVSTGSAYRTAQNVTDELGRLQAIRKVSPNEDANRGWLRLVAGASRWMSWPEKIEDMSRMSAYLNARKIGHSPGVAAELTDEALFDYLKGLTAFEQRVMRRVVPFYSWTRFAVPLATKMGIKTPGKAAGASKFISAFAEAWNVVADGGTLTEDQRRVLPGYLLEQPSFFERLDPKTGEAVFKTFNNFTLFDLFGFVESDGDGNMDWQGTMLNGILAQITPLVKVPLEVAVRRDFFTGRELPDEIKGARRQKGDLDPDKVFAGLLSVVGAEAFRKLPGPEAFGIAAGQIVGRVTSSLFPAAQQQVLKQLLGWEEGIDPRTGEREVYVNPFILHVAMNSYPALAQAFQVARDDQTPLERSMRLFPGIGTVRLDLSQEQAKRVREFRHERDRLIREVRDAMREERLDSYGVHLKELEEWLEQMKDEALAVAAADVTEQ